MRMEAFVNWRCIEHLHSYVKYDIRADQRIIIKSSRLIPSTSSRNDDRATKPTRGAGWRTSLPTSHSLASDIMMRKAVEARSDTSGGK